MTVCRGSPKWNDPNPLAPAHIHAYASAELNLAASCHYHTGRDHLDRSAGTQVEVEWLFQVRFRVGLGGVGHVEQLPTFQAQIGHDAKSYHQQPPTTGQVKPARNRPPNGHTLRRHTPHPNPDPGP